MEIFEDHFCFISNTNRKCRLFLRLMINCGPGVVKSVLEYACVILACDDILLNERKELNELKSKLCMLRNILTSNTFLLFFALLWLRLVFATENSGCHGGKRMVTISLKASCATMKSWKSWLFGYFVNKKKSLTMDDKSKNHSRSRDYRCRTDEDKAGFRQNAETGKAGRWNSANGSRLRTSDDGITEMKQDNEANRSFGDLV